MNWTIQEWLRRRLDAPPTRRASPACGSHRKRWSCWLRRGGSAGEPTPPDMRAAQPRANESRARRAARRGRFRKRSSGAGSRPRVSGPAAESTGSWRRRATARQSHNDRGGPQEMTRVAERDYRGGRNTDPRNPVGLTGASGILRPNRSTFAGSTRAAKAPHSCESTVIDGATGGIGAAGVREHEGPLQGGRTGVSRSGRSVGRPRACTCCS
jgi:hypothetical protein